MNAAIPSPDASTKKIKKRLAAKKLMLPEFSTEVHNHGVRPFMKTSCGVR
jgi:hypothetical protein